MTEQQRLDPAWDPKVRWRVQHALNQILMTAQDLVTRYTDQYGCYQPPPDVAEMGNTTGLIEEGYGQVVHPLMRKLDETRAAIQAAYDEIEAYKREIYGPAYRPPHREPF